MRLDISTRLEQQMKLSPRMIQAMEILQMPLMDLQERIESELQSNPVLEVQPAEDETVEAPQDAADESPPDRGETAMVVREDRPADDFQRMSEFQDEYEPWLYPDQAPARARAGDDGQRDRKLDAMANAPALAQTLCDYLLQQWMFVETDDLTRQAGEVLINAIDEDGYLRTPLEEIAASEDAKDKIPLQALRNALAQVQTLEPPGVVARDLRECLLLQLQAEAAAGQSVELELTLVQDYLRDIELNRLPQISRRTGKSVEEIRKAIGNLSHLTPRPGSLVGQRAVPVVVPDVVVEFDEQGNVVVSVPQSLSPHLHISRAYQRMAKDQQTDRDAKTFLRRNIRSAQWLISAVEQRRHTLRRVVEEIFDVQKEFLYSGSEALKPLPMADVAEKVGVHVATVSRTVAGKYVQTPIGIWPLRMFFSGGKMSSGGQDMAWDAIRSKLRDVIDAEDKQNPLNDDQIVAELAKHGIKIARRTVAKYRDLMDIPPKQKRRRY